MCKRRRRGLTSEDESGEPGDPARYSVSSRMLLRGLELAGDSMRLDMSERMSSVRRRQSELSPTDHHPFRTRIKG